MRLRLGLLLAAVLTAGVLFAGAGSASASVVWLCHPLALDNPCDTAMDTTTQHADGSSEITTPAKPSKPKVDCFYVYPTTSNQLTVNADKARDPELKAIAKFQAARFGLDCRIFAPVYRQLTLVGLETASVAQKAAAFKIAYGDVREAWRDYLAHENDGRGVVFIGHSQGTRMLRQLLHDEIDPKPSVRRLVVSAFLPGGNVLVRKGSDRGGDFQTIPACHAATQFGCVMAFSTFNYGPPRDTRFGRSPETDPGTGLPWGSNYEVLCTNPASLGPNTRQRLTTLFPSSLFPPLIGVLNILMFGGPQPTAATTWVQPADTYSGRCQGNNGANIFFIAPIGNAHKLNAIPDSTWGQHLADGNIALGNVVDVVIRQTSHYMTCRRQKTAARKAHRTATVRRLTKRC